MQNEQSQSPGMMAEMHACWEIACCAGEPVLSLASKCDMEEVCHFGDSLRAQLLLDCLSLDGLLSKLACACMHIQCVPILH